MKAGLWGVSNRWLQRFWARVDRSGGESSCWIWTGAKNADGYGRLHFGGKADQAHRVAWQLKHGAIPHGKVIRHKVCDNPPCVNPAHLLLGSRADNVRDAVEKRRHVHGERSRSARLTEEQVADMRMRFRNGDSRYSLAARFGVTHRMVCLIVNGQRWKHSAVEVSPIEAVPPETKWRRMIRERIRQRRRSA